MKYLKYFESINVIESPAYLVGDYNEVIDKLDDYLTELSDEGYSIHIGVDVLYLNGDKRVYNLRNIHNGKAYVAIGILINSIINLYPDPSEPSDGPFLEDKRLQDSNKVRDFLIVIFNRLNLGSNFKFMFIDNYSFYQAFIWNENNIYTK